MALNEDAVRDMFPSLQQNHVYMDNAAGSQVLGPVIESIKDYLITSNVQLGASYDVSRRSTGCYAAAFDEGAKFINANVDEIVFGPSVTQLFRNLAYSLRFKPGDEILVSGIDHEANINPWLDLASRQGLLIKWWKPQGKTNPRLLADDLKSLLTPRTRLVTCTHASNVLGTIHNIKAICRVAHDAGALVCVDGVAYAPHRPVDVKHLEVDFYAFSWYKVFGPHVAMMYASWNAQSQVRSLGHFFNPHNSLADRLGLSGGSYELIQSIPNIVDYLGTPKSDNWKTVCAQETLLQGKLLQYLNTRKDATVYGVLSNDATYRLPTISFTIAGWDSKKLVEAIEARTKYGIRWGAFYSERLVRGHLGLGPSGVVRVSLLHYNRVCEVEGLVKSLHDILGDPRSPPRSPQ